MRFEAREVTTLPPLAWCARLDRKAGTVTAWHGAAVEVDSAGLVDGAWDGPFGERDLAAARIICGTGLRVDGDTVRFFAGSDKRAPLYSLVQRGELHVSNSLPFVLAVAGEAPDEDYPFYAYDFLLAYRAGSTVGGRRLRTSGGGTLRLHIAGSLVATASGVHHAAPPAGPRPHDFTSYKRLLADGVAAVLDNASDPARRHRYTPLSAISRGYDSVAVSALARDAGCEETFTLRDSDAPDPDADSGLPISRALGMRCIVRDRRAYRTHGGVIEPLFALWPVATNVPLACCADVLAGRILLTGCGGDHFWHPRLVSACSHLAQSWTNLASGFGMHEFRLHARFIVAAPPMIGCLHNRSLHAIAGSGEMNPWRIGGDYDRPLPRRIAEEAGVPREAFGMHKAASGHVHLIRAESFTPDGLASLRHYMATRDACATGPRRHAWRARAAARNWWWSVTRGRRYRYVPSSPLQRALPFTVNARPFAIPWGYAFTMQWSVASLRGRYALRAA